MIPAMDVTSTGFRPLRRWIAGIWLSVALFDASQNVLVMRAEGMVHPWTRVFAGMVLFWLPWALATPLLLHVGRLYPPVQWKRLSTWITHITALAAICVVAGAWAACLVELLNPWGRSSGPEPFVPLWIQRCYNGILPSVFVYAAILGVCYLLDSREQLAQQRIKTARLNEQFSKAQLDALRRQIEPHFLFNGLNAIAGLIRERRNDAAVDMVVRFSEFLRKVLEDSDRVEVPLEEEVQFAQKYLDIQKVRFADRLQLDVNVPKEFASAQVPSLILQPIIENAIKHGIARQARGGTIRITAFRSNDLLTLSIYNDGPKLRADWEQTQAGVGISNVRTRLQGLYGNEFRFSLRNHEPSGVEVLVSVPFREE